MRDPGRRGGTSTPLREIIIIDLYILRSSFISSFGYRLNVLCLPPIQDEFSFYGKDLVIFSPGDISPDGIGPT